MIPEKAMADVERLNVAGFTITILQRECHFDVASVTIGFAAAQVRGVAEERLKQMALQATVTAERRDYASVKRLDETRFLVGLVTS